VCRKNNLMQLHRARCFPPFFILSPSRVGGGGRIYIYAAFSCTYIKCSRTTEINECPTEKWLSLASAETNNCWDYSSHVQHIGFLHF